MNIEHFNMFTGVKLYHKNFESKDLRKILDSKNCGLKY